MQHKLKSLLWGTLPLVAGYLINYFISNISFSRTINTLSGIIFLFTWFFVSLKISKPSIKPIIQSVLFCSFGFIMLVLVLYQEIYLGRYWMNLLGSASQIFFLPLLSFVSTLFTPIIGLLMPIIRVWPYYIVEYIFLFLASLLACIIKQKKI